MADDKVLLKVNCPKWFLIIFPLALLFSILIVTLMWIYFSNDGFTFLEVGGLTIFLPIFGIWLWLIPFLFSSVTAHESGLQVTGPLVSDLRFTWEEIVKVSRPFLGIPKEFIYIFSKDGEKMTLLRSMEGYLDLLELIESRAPNLLPKKLPREVWPRKRSWGRTWLVIIGFLVVYVALKLIFSS